MLTENWLKSLKRLSTWRVQGQKGQRIRCGNRWSARRVQSSQIEVLEDRALLSWIAQGPGPTINAQVTIPANNPVNGAIQSIAAHPNNSDIIFAGTVNGGVWKTTNATSSNTWTPLTDGLQSQSIGAIEFDVTDGTFNTLLAGTGRWSNYGSIGDDQGLLYYTTNGGTSWTAFAPAVLSNQRISAVAARGNTWLVTSTSGGVYRSTNGGASWANINGLNGLGTGTTQDMAADPSDANRFYVSMTGGGGKLFRTDDAGATWTDTTGSVSGVSGASRVRLAVNASAGAVYVAVGAGGAGAATKVWRSANQGGSWTQLDDVFVHNGGQQNPNTSLAADPTNANLVYVGGDRITGSPFTALSSRGDATAASGSQWTILVNAGATNTAPHADTRDMAFRADGTLLESDDGGLYRHTNPSGTGSWVAAAGNIQAIEAHNVAYKTLNNTFVIGTQDNGTHQQTTSGNTQWNFINGGDGGDVAVDNVTLAASNRSIVYLSSQNLGGFRRVVYDSNNNFVSSTSLASITSPNFTTPIELNTIDPMRILIGGQTALFESTDQGSTNTNIGGPGQPGFLQNAMVYGGSKSGTPNPDLIYVGASSAVQKRTTSGGAFTATTALPSGAAQVTDVAIDPDNYDTVFASDSNQVFMSSNGGSTWSDITGNLTSVSSTEFRTMEYVPGNIVDAITIGTRSGVFFALMSAPTVWAELSTGLPDVLVFDMEYVPSQDLLVAGTFGRAVWTLPNASQEFFSTDFGDAPSGYGTLLANNGARHSVVPGLKLGANTDTEADATPNVRALGDDTIGVGDDEDGIIQPMTDLVMTIGAAPTVTLRTTNTTGLSATLYGWIDYDNDGQFENTTERASANVSTGTNNGLVTLTFPAVPGSFTGTTYARFRLSTAATAANPTGAASNGEVEDYLVSIVQPSDLTVTSSKTKLIGHQANGGPTLVDFA